MPSPPARSATVPRCAARANSSGLSPWVHRQQYFLRQSLSHTPSSLYPGQHCAFRGFFSSTRRLPDLPRRCPESLRDFPALLQPRRLASTGAAMAAEKIDGTQIAKSIREGLKDEIEKVQEVNPRFKPSLVIFQGTSLARTLRGKVLTCSGQVGNRSDSSESYCIESRRWGG